MTWDISLAKEGVTLHAAAWDELNRSKYRNHPFLSSDFWLELIRHFGSGKEILALHHSGETIDGFTILEKKRYGTWSTFLPSQAQIGMTMIPQNSELLMLLKALPGASLSLEILGYDPSYMGDLHHQETDNSALLTHLNTINVVVDSDFDTYWEPRDKKLRENIRRYLRRIDTDNVDMKLNEIRKPDDIVAALKRYGDMESAGWKGKNGTAISHDNAQGRFYSDLLTRMAAKDSCRMYELYFGSELAASQICLNNAEFMILLKTTYDENLSRYSPGRLMQYEILRRAFEEKNFDNIEFYTNAKKEDAKWATHNRETFHLTKYRSAFVKNAISAARNFRK